jgi:hypothetical protein
MPLIKTTILLVNVNILIKLNLLKNHVFFKCDFAKNEHDKTQGDEIQLASMFQNLVVPRLKRDDYQHNPCRDWPF